MDNAQAKQQAIKNYLESKRNLAVTAQANITGIGNERNTVGLLQAKAAGIVNALEDAIDHVTKVEDNTVNYLMAMRGLAEKQKKAAANGDDESGNGVDMAYYEGQIIALTEAIYYINNKL